MSLPNMIQDVVIDLNIMKKQEAELRCKKY